MKKIPSISVFNKSNVDIPYKNWSSKYHIFPIIDIEINGIKTPINLDTGSTMTSITPEFARELHVQTIDIGTITSKNDYLSVVEKYKFGIIKTLNVNGIVLKNLPVMIGSTGNSDVLGLNFFSRLRNIIFYRDHVLVNSTKTKEKLFLEQAT